MRLRGTRLAGLAGTVALLTAACGPTLSLHTVDPRPAATITTTPATQAPIGPRDGISVSVADGRLVSVDLIGPDGPITGSLSADLTAWQPVLDALAYGAQYRLTARAVDWRGNPVTATRTISTVDPDHRFGGEMVSPAPGSTVGVGMPVTVRFDRPITDRAAVERSLHVISTRPRVGAWSWQDDQTVLYRPLTYWPGDTDVTVAIDTFGVAAAPDLYGRKDRTYSFHIGPSMVTKVDAATHQADVYRDGELIRTIPITTGKPGFETRSGVKVIMTRERTRVMDAATTGTPTDSNEYYRLKVEYAMRLTNSGEFLHAAPWSVGSQGFANVSHGCVGMSLSNAAWLFDESEIGDVVEITGTDNAQDLGNGITVWNVDWPTWLANSATGWHASELAPAAAGAAGTTMRM